MAKHLRIVKGCLVGPTGKSLKPGDNIYVQGHRINDPIEYTLEGWSRQVSWPSGEVKESIKVAEQYFSKEPADCFASAEDAITPLLIANEAEVKIGDRVWIYVPGYKGMVEKRVLFYTSNRVALCYADAYEKCKKNEQGKGYFITSHEPTDVYSTREEIIKAKDLTSLSIAPLRAIHKIVRRPL